MNRTETISLLVESQVAILNEDSRRTILNDWWFSIKEEDEDYNKLPVDWIGSLPQDLRLEIANKEEWTSSMSSKYIPIMVLALYYGNYRGTKNQYLEKRLYELIGERVIVIGNVERLEKCPCCDYRTLDAVADWDICRVCFWEDDGVRELNSRSSPNHMTLRDGRANFEEMGACSTNAIQFIDKEGGLKYEKEG